jgi:hypothetical protein
LLAKIADGVHQQRYQPQHVALITSAERCGFELVDLAIVNRAGKRPIDPKWRQVMYLRNSHARGLVLRRDRAATEQPGPVAELDSFTESSRSRCSSEGSSTWTLPACC